MRYPEFGRRTPKLLISLVIVVITIPLETDVFGGVEPGASIKHLVTEEKLDGKEIGPLVEVQRFRARGQLQVALELCNKVLATNPDNKYVRLEKAEIYEELHQTGKAEQELEDLTARAPAFQQAWLSRARILVQKPFSVDGGHPIIDWLKSPDPRKQRAALEVLQESIRSAQKGRPNSTAK